ncbi:MULTISPECIES: hypothetical protein [unclassified Nocardia]|uniref:hypothetical protein n=1 Tax=unclassified Nocardia TaxID=2637762 RepID=UPI001CE3F9BC|nr:MULTISPECIES: hypothetical protein [unclassified Nocardia]
MRRRAVFRFRTPDAVVPAKVSGSRARNNVREKPIAAREPVTYVFEGESGVISALALQIRSERTKPRDFRRISAYSR